MASLDDIWKTQQPTQRRSLDDLYGKAAEKPAEKPVEKYPSGVPKTNTGPLFDAFKQIVGGVGRGRGLGDVGKGAAKGVVEGLTDFGTMEQAGREQALGITPEASELAPHQRAGAGGQDVIKHLPSPEGGAGQATEALSRTFSNPMTYLGLGRGGPAAAYQRAPGTPGAMPWGTQLPPPAPAPNFSQFKGPVQDILRQSPKAPKQTIPGGKASDQIAARQPPSAPAPSVTDQAHAGVMEWIGGHVGGLLGHKVPIVGPPIGRAAGRAIGRKIDEGAMFKQ